MVTIRPAVEQDIPQILELYRQLNFQPEKHVNPALADCNKVFARISKVPGASLLVVEEGGKVIGTTFLAILPGMAHGTKSFAVVEYVVVDEARRSKGVGKLMMEYCKDLAKKAGCYKIILTSDKRRKQAHKFYESIGFAASAEGFRFYF